MKKLFALLLLFTVSFNLFFSERCKMKITELINNLENLKKEFGDLEVITGSRDIDGVTCYGSSETLGLNSRIEDIELLKQGGEG